jgi:hypothetical protein
MRCIGVTPRRRAPCEEPLLPKRRLMQYAREYVGLKLFQLWARLQLVLPSSSIVKPLDANCPALFDNRRSRRNHAGLRFGSRSLRRRFSAERYRYSRLKFDVEVACNRTTKAGQRPYAGEVIVCLVKCSVPLIEEIIICSLSAGTAATSINFLTGHQQVKGISADR